MQGTKKLHLFASIAHFVNPSVKKKAPSILLGTDKRICSQIFRHGAVSKCNKHNKNATVNKQHINNNN